jgi:hypothetical protein
MVGLLLFFGKQHCLFCPTIHSPLLCLPMMKLSKAKAAATFFPTLPSPLLCFADDEIVQVHTLNGI